MSTKTLLAGAASVALAVLALLGGLSAYGAWLSGSGWRCALLVVCAAAVAGLSGSYAHAACRPARR